MLEGLLDSSQYHFPVDSQRQSREQVGHLKCCSKYFEPAPYATASIENSTTILILTLQKIHTISQKMGTHNSRLPITITLESVLAKCNGEWNVSSCYVTALLYKWLPILQKNKTISNLKKESHNLFKNEYTKLDVESVLAKCKTGWNVSSCYETASYHN